MSDASSNQAPSPIKGDGSPENDKNGDGSPAGASSAEIRNPNDTIRKIEAELVLAGIEEPKAQRLAVRFVRKLHRGPLPPVEDFIGYEEVCPGAAREILDMAVRQQKHAHEIEQKIIDAEVFAKKSGIPAAILVVLIIIGAVVLCADAGHDAVAGGLAAISLTTLVALFLKSDLLGAKPVNTRPRDKAQRDRAQPAPVQKATRKRRPKQSR